MSNEQAAHTPEPWVAVDSTVWANGEDLGSCFGRHTTVEQDHTNAQRIVAAVNACQGIPTDHLQPGLVAKLVEALEAARAALSTVRVEDFKVKAAVYDCHRALGKVETTLQSVKGE